MQDSIVALSDVLTRLRSFPRGAAYRARFQARGGDVSTSVRQVLRTVELLSCHGEVCVADVADALTLESSSASRQVDVAVRAGLISKTQSRIDSRRLALVLTDRGREVVTAWETERRQHLDEALARWSTDELDKLVRVTTELADAVERLEGRP